MFATEDLEIWNLTPGGTARTGAQAIFNVAGRVKRFSGGSRLFYSLNGEAEQPVFLGYSPRFSAPGDFNIDSIDTDALTEENLLEFNLIEEGRSTRASVRFKTKPFGEQTPTFDLDLEGVQNAEEIGQIIEGHWRVDRDESGRPCLSLRPEDASYDRLIGFGRADWTTGYEIETLFVVNKWTERLYFNAGQIFKWNPHVQGHGESLPTQWSTGLAYYAAKCPGLRLRFGVDVHEDEFGQKQGSYVLQEKPYSAWRRWAGFVRNELIRIGKKPIPQLLPSVPYRIRTRIAPDRYAFTIWEDGSPEPSPQLEVADPPDMLPVGCVGLIACNCALNVYEYRVRPTNR
ncbi:MAG: hypothetical protein MJE12_18335 [Alphaproteobacteria bacterium]|nr:hypothetical protein [Alphaproteobacteria bacterium]